MSTKTYAEADNEIGEQIESNAKLYRAMRRNSIANGALAVAVVALVAYQFTIPKPNVIFETIDAQGHLLQTPARDAGVYTAEERELFVRELIRNLRTRTGIAAVDSANLASWSPRVTAAAAKAWEGMGPRFKGIGLVEADPTITLGAVAVTSDRVHPNGVVAEWVETITKKVGTSESWRVRVTVYLTDPQDTRFLMAGGIALHTEEKL